MKKNKVIVLGLGIGGVYVEQALELGYDVTTVDKDPTKNPTYLSLDDIADTDYDLGIICLPNFLHEAGLLALQGRCKKILIEKPGLRDYNTWKRYLNEGFDISMVKNNMFRVDTKNIDVSDAKKIHIRWLNTNRVPHPGSWFTNSMLAWGGVSYDLMPHLLHIAIDLVNNDGLEVLDSYKKQRWNLENLVSTDYGTIDRTGIYNVDDYATVEMESNGIEIICEASWKTDIVKEDTFDITIFHKDGREEYYSLGKMCPNYAYGLMLKNYVEDKKLYNDLEIDKFVLQTIEEIKAWI